MNIGSLKSKYVSEKSILHTLGVSDSCASSRRNTRKNIQKISGYRHTVWQVGRYTLLSFIPMISNLQSWSQTFRKWTRGIPFCIQVEIL